MHDFGLAGDASGRVFLTLSGARRAYLIDSPDLPQRLRPAIRCAA